MRAKALVIFSLVMVVLLFTVGLSWARGGMAHRETKQFQRIAGGVKGGVITQRAYSGSHREQWRIKQTTGKAHAYWRPNPLERRRVDALRVKASKDVYSAKHREATRYDCQREYYGQRHFHGKPGYSHPPVYYGFGPTTYGFQFRGRYSEPYYSFAWSIGW